MHVCVYACMCMCLSKWRVAALWRYNGIKTSTVYKEKPVCSIQPQLCNRSRKHAQAQKIEKRRKYSSNVIHQLTGINREQKRKGRNSHTKAIPKQLMVIKTYILIINLNKNILMLQKTDIDRLVGYKNKARVYCI